MSPPEPADLAVSDLFDVVELGRERLGSLLTPAERTVCARILGLPASAARVYARLSARRRIALRVDGLDVPPDALEHLIAVGLLAEGAPWPPRLQASLVAELRTFCQQRGLDPTGRRAALIERLWDKPEVPADARWVWRPQHRLIARLERAAFLQRAPERGRLVAERLGHMRFATYEVTGGRSLWRSRAHLLAWEDLLDGVQTERLAPGRALVARQRGEGRAPGRLSLVRRLDKTVLGHADALRRDGRAEEALAWLDALRIVRDQEAGLALRRSRLLEDLDRRSEALAVLEAARQSWTGPDRLAIQRSGRRLARAQRRAWIPDPPLQKPRSRVLRLEPDKADHRPRWVVGEGSAHVESAVQWALSEVGRESLRAEGHLVRTLFALLFAEALFAPVADQLPVPRLSGPLDLGRPAFAARRPRQVQRVLDRIREGEAPGMIRAAAERFDRVQLAGRARDLSDPTPWIRAAQSLGPAGVRALVEPLLRRGWGAAKGLPDLLVLDGAAVRLPDAHPSRLGPEGLFVEVKGPGDSLSDAQRHWLDALIRAGVPVEVWNVEAR